ncbi:hypothetical protein [Caldalkalibacillus mannanilyticus]|uniref:hypothetical protein n=1 Tax=Caldalkalibacillus mannanilyticus TaxID=1418 RepID=UPI000468AE3C|nr:hypothetical protein [Caldalkalibacillus mannanilyticus]
MLRFLPLGFWLSIILFLVFQWLSLPIIEYFTYRAVHVLWGIIIILGIIYPIYFASTMIYLKKVQKLTVEQLIVAGAFLLIPVISYIPLLT